MTATALSSELTGALASSTRHARRINGRLAVAGDAVAGRVNRLPERAGTLAAGRAVRRRPR